MTLTCSSVGLPATSYLPETRAVDRPTLAAGAEVGLLDVRHAPTTKQGEAGLAVLVRTDPSGTPLDGEAARILRVDATTMALGTTVATEGTTDVKTAAVAVAARRLATGRLRTVLRLATDRVPLRPVVPPAVPSIGPTTPLEVGDGVLGVAAPQAVDVGRVGAASKKGVVVAERPTDAGTGVVAADGSST